MLKINGSIYSKYRPVREINNINKNSNYIVLGLGLGYEIKQIIENTTGLVYIIDKDRTFYEIVKENNLLNKLIIKDKVKFFLEMNIKK